MTEQGPQQNNRSAAVAFYVVVASMCLGAAQNLIDHYANERLDVINAATAFALLALFIWLAWRCLRGSKIAASILAGTATIVLVGIGGMLIVYDLAPTEQAGAVVPALACAAWLWLSTPVLLKSKRSSSV
jgi:hypothetical protein